VNERSKGAEAVPSFGADAASGAGGDVSGKGLGSAGENPSARIDLLAAAAASTAGDGDDWILAGWTEDGSPLATTDVRDLSAGAAAAFLGFRESGLWPRQVPYGAVEAVEYAMTGPAVDFADHAGQVAQDQVQLAVLDQTGDRAEHNFGELALLEAIVQARDPWQAALPGSSAELARAAAPFFTLFVAHPRGGAGRGMAILFRPTTSRSGNEAAFAAFVRQATSRLLVLDESQPPGMRKGYLQAAARSAGVHAGDERGLLAWLRKIGVVDYDDEGIARKEAGLLVSLLRALRKIGLVEVSDERLEEIEDVRPVYDLDRLDTAGLVSLAEAMYRAAARVVRP
jgi:hypothetical protein